MSLLKAICTPKPDGSFPHGNDIIEIKNKLFTSAVREEGQVFETLITDISKIHTLNLSPEHKKGLFAHLQSFIPFFMPRGMQSIKLTDFLGQERSYRVKLINIAPSGLRNISPYEVVALTPQQPNEYASMLIFMGTTPPTYDSFETTNIANLFPTISPGNLLTFNSNEVKQWAENQQKIDIYGQSLGGGLALAHADMLKNVRSVSATNPALPHRYLSCKDVDVDIYINEQDWVSKLGGLAPKHAKVHRVKPAKLKTSLKSRFVLTHIQPFIGSSKSQITTESGDALNRYNAPYYKIITIYILRLIAYLVVAPVLLLFGLIRKARQTFTGTPNFRGSSPPATPPATTAPQARSGNNPAFRPIPSSPTVGR